MICSDLNYILFVFYCSTIYACELLYDWRHELKLICANLRLTFEKKSDRVCCQLGLPQPTLDKNTLCGDSTTFLATLKIKS